MAVELERSYVFSHKSIPHILKFLGAQTIGLDAHRILDNLFFINTTGEEGRE